MTDHHDAAPPPTRAEEGELIGTLRQFARAVGAPRPIFRRCAEAHDRAIVLSRPDQDEPVFILDPDALAAVERCASVSGDGR